ncbi:hypothetical protein CVIC8964_0681 [Campylobacter vicugnae]|uniref:Uncharacterized protein n=1 Tax=Campylobacter vicugnae TaxID=1660076 RepID=A0A1X9T0Y3_9BACT|nr:hypothetical protein CVIC8964_0681 [Campylobacter sp. RM8964]
MKICLVVIVVIVVIVSIYHGKIAAIMESQNVKGCLNCLACEKAYEMLNKHISIINL